MTNLKPLEEIANEASDVLLMLHLNSSKRDLKHQVKGRVRGFRWSDGEIYPISESDGTIIKYISSRVSNLGVDISNGTYLGIHISGYEIVRIDPRRG